MQIKRLMDLTRSSPFLRMNAIFFLGSMVVAFLNYLYYPILGRLLPTSLFGELQVIVSTFMQMTIILNVLSMISISLLINEKDKKRAEETVHELEQLSLYGGIVFLAVIALAAEPLRQALKFESFYPFLAIGVVFVVTIPLTFRNAQLKAHQDFVGTSIANAIGAVAKLVFSVILVLLALKTFGAVIGILSAQLVALLYTNYRAKKYGYEIRSRKRRLPNWTILKPQLPYALFVLLVSLLTTLQVSIDVTIVKYLFDPEQAGNYSAVATISRIIFFATASIVAVLLSSIDRHQPPKKNIHVLTRSFLLTCVIGGSITALFCLAPTFIMHILMGSRYDVFTHLLPLLSLATLAGSLVTLLTTYHIALRSYWALVPVATGSIITGVLMVLRHGTLDLVVANILIGSSLMFAFTAVYTAFSLKNSIK